MQNKIAMLSLLGALCLIPSGCGGNNETPNTQAQTTTKAPDKAPKANNDNQNGLEHKKNNTEIVGLAKEVLKCEWKNSRPNSKCEAWKKWGKSSLLRKAQNDHTLVNFLSDKNEKVRWLGTSGLRRSSGKNSYQKDKELASRIIEAAKTERSPLVSPHLGVATARINGEKTGFLDVLKKMITEHENKELRYKIASNFLIYNRSEANYKYVLDLARKKDDVALKAALASSLWTGTPSGKGNETCQLWMEFAQNKDKNLSGHSSNYIAGRLPDKGCSAYYDKLLAEIEKRADNGNVQSNLMSYAMSRLYKQKHATPEQKTKTIALAKKVLSNDKNAAMCRSTALKLIGEADPKAAQELAKTYEKDKEYFLKSTAAKILKGELKPKEKKPKEKKAVEKK